MKKKLLLFLLCGLLFGCSNKLDIEFKDVNNLEVKQEYNACEFVAKINNVDVTEDMIQNDKIVLDSKNYVTCMSGFSPTELGDFRLTYKLNNKKEVFYTVNVVDSTPPEIKTKKDQYEVEQGNLYFDIANEISFVDNYDMNPMASIDHDIDIDQIGEYEVNVVAKDSSGNESRKKIMVDVIEKEKEIETIYVNNSSGSRTSSASSNDIEQANSSVTSSQSASSSSGNSGSGTSGSKQEKPAQPQQPTSSAYIKASGVSVKVGTSIGDVVAMITGSIESSAGYSIDYSEVNTSAPGSYPVYVYGSDGASTSCTVTVSE